MTQATKLSKAALALATLVAPAFALAASNPQVDTRLSNFKLQAFDITPGDGVAAGYVVNNQTIHLDNIIRSYQGGEGSEVRDSRDLAAGAAFDSTVTLAQFTSVASGNGSLGNLSISSTWDAATPFAGSYQSAVTEYFYDAQLTLAAGTTLVFSGTVQQTFVPAGIDREDEAGSLFSTYLRGPDVGTGSYQSYFFANEQYDWYNDYQGWDKTSTFAITFTNSTNADMTVDLEWSLMSDLAGRSPLVSAVPEPATYAMLGTGIALVAGLARRRKRFA